MNPRRVLHVIGAMVRGGAESLLMDIYRSIDKDQYQFDFLVHEERKCDFDDEIEQIGGRIFRLPRLWGINSLAYFSACRAFFEAHHDYCAVHVHIGSSAALVIRAAKRHGLFCIAHSHNTNPPISILELGFRFFSFPTRYLADCYLACSYRAGVERFGRKVADGDRFAVLGNGIDLPKYLFDEKVRFEYRSALGLEGSGKAICHIGRFVEQKNHLFLLESFAFAVKKDPLLRLFLVGRGPLESDIKQQAATLGIKDHVSFLGVRDDVPKLLMGMDGFVFPSKWEGFGIAALEAQASGLPCLLSPELPDSVFCVPWAKKMPSLDSPSAWGEEMLVMPIRSAGERIAGIGPVRAAGFDISETVSMLETLYSEHRLEAV